MMSAEQKAKIAWMRTLTGKQVVDYHMELIRKQDSGELPRPVVSEESDLITAYGLPLFFGDNSGIDCPWRDDAFLLTAPGSTPENRIPSNTAWVCFGPQRGTAVTQHGEPMDCDPEILKYFENNAEIARKHGNL